jgi:hypothetical protein
MEYAPSAEALSIISHIAQLEPSGWHSGANISWEVGGEAKTDRDFVRQVLNELHRAQLIRRMFVQHAGRPIPCFLLEPAQLEDLIEGWTR